jgi:phage-related protein
MAIGFNVGGSLGTVAPDKGFTRNNTPRVHVQKFGDGYEQRLANGINNLEQDFSVQFATRPKDEIDDIVAFFESKKGATAFDFNFADTNESGNEETVKIVCESWDQTWDYDDFYSLSAKFRRIYEA